MLRPSLFLTLLPLAPLAAQIPEGWIVVSSTSSIPGLHALPARGGSAPLPLANVPAELVLTVGLSRGANTVAIHPDGRVFAGNLGIATGSPIALHALQLNGLTVAASTRVQLGTSVSTTGSVNALAFLPDGRCLVAANGLQAGSAMQRLAIVDIDAGVVTPLSVTGAPATTYNAITVNDAGTLAWFGTFASTTSGQIWRVTLPTGGPAALVGSYGMGLSGLDVANDGRLVVSGLNAGVNPSAGFVDPNTGAFTPITGTSANTSAVAVERATGDVMLTSITNSTQEVRHAAASGPTTPLWTAFAGTVTGVDVQDSPRRYGVGTPLANTYRWQVAPNAGGVPFLGNTAFALTVVAQPAAPLLTVAAFAPTRAAVTALGVTILVDPLQAIVVAAPAALTADVPVPIPNDPALAGVVLHAQCLHLEAGGFAASDGVTFGPVVP